MNAGKLTEAVLQKPLVLEGIKFETEGDNKPAIEKILEGLARKASTGDPAAARELREWLGLQVEITGCN